MSKTNKILEYQQAQFDQIFGALDTIGAGNSRKIEAFITNYARDFTPDQIQVIADLFAFTQDQTDRAIAEFEKTLDQ